MLKTMTFLLFYIISFNTFSQECRTSLINFDTPTSRFIPLKEGAIVLDKETQLIWQRCSLGQSWENNGECTGNAKKYSFYKAQEVAKFTNFSGFNDWRVPTIDELESIIELACYEPAINTTIFPNTEISANYWSSSSYVSDVFNSWSVRFHHGYNHHGSRLDDFFVRLVRVEE